jgi:hypothetical protein
MDPPSSISVAESMRNEPENVPEGEKAPLVISNAITEAWAGIEMLKQAISARSVRSVFMGPLVHR